MRRDVKYDEDVRSSSSHGSPSIIEENEEVVPTIDLETLDELDLEEDVVILGVDMPLPSTPTQRRLRWLT